MGEWKETTLGGFLTLQRGFDLPMTDRVNGPYPVIASNGPVGTHKEAMVKGPGVVIGRSGSIGGGQYIQGDYWPLNTTLWVKEFHGNDERFCYYLLKSIDLTGFNAGSGVPTLNRNHIHPLPVRVPSDVAEQRAIAHILGTLDDKIELNRRTNETLEAIARALFRSWFVDFDPVHRNAARRRGQPMRGQPSPPSPLPCCAPSPLPLPVGEGWPTGRGEGAVEGNAFDHLFPDSFVNSELGKIPKGWGVGTLGEHVQLVKGRSYKSEELASSNTALVTLKSFARGGGYRVDGLKSYTGSYKQNQIVVPGEVVLSCTDVTQAAEVIGRTALVRTNLAYSTLVASLDVLIIRPKPPLTRLFIYELGRTEAFVDHTYAHCTGTTVLHLSKDAVPTFRFAMPSPAIVSSFDRLVAPIIQCVERIESELHTLAATRDALLPKLLSGEIRIKDAEKFVEVAA